ncbi:unnamed protein product [Cladocopium goreaui]|uniref:Major basic nuclear protein 2 n=1 Tax=Cladocopium goreaui TaxID=2562237 RepID=A0A9P1CG62_9DINO|nr:unnamed protein product [Cladocopium goreaui]
MFVFHLTYLAQVQSAGAAFYSTSTIADHVDVFISHSWSAGRWGKFFSLCLFFNLELAIKCSFAMWSLLAIALVGMFGVAGLGGNACVFPCLVCLPVVTFFVVFIFGQDLTGARWSMSLWVDKLCIHQTDLDLKAQQIAALPVFVAHASRMLILWDETYFERLWCNLELATFVHRGGIQNVDLLPLWLAPWLLCSILLDLLSASLFELMEHVLPNWSMRWIPPIMEATGSMLGKNPAMLNFVAVFIVWMFSGVTYLMVSVPSFFSFRMKLRNHQLLLNQMSSFDVRAAKCTLLADRSAIEEHVVALFDSGTVPLKEGSGVDDGEVRLQRFSLDDRDPLSCFNEHVKGPLRALVESQIGSELHVPFQIALTACLPMIFYSSVNVLACDNGPCETSAVLSGYSSVTQYMVTQVVGWTLTIFLSFPVTSPILLRMIGFVVSCSDGPLELFMALLCCPLAYIWITNLRMHPRS